MATKASHRSENGNTKIRFIMLEADGNAADLQQIAQAITNAVRPTFIQIPAPQSAIAIPQASVRAIDAPEEVAIVDDAPNAVHHSAPSKKPSGNGQKRKLPVPEVIDLGLTGGNTPLAQFIQEKNPTDHSKRYLVIAAWLKDYRQIDEITINHIYTFYRSLKLNVVPDVAGVFRSNKKQGWFNSGTQRGMYAINHVGLGLGLVNDLGGGD